MRAFALALCGLTLAPLVAEAATGIHAHRGGPYREGVPKHGENTLGAFEAAIDEHFVVELDVKLTSDRVPVVLHDATLDRTTNCTGQVAKITAADLRARCRVDVLGVPGNPEGLKVAPAPGGGEPVPTLAETLALLRHRGARSNIEIKNVPTDADFEPGTAFATRILDEIDVTLISHGQVIVQSFWPPNLGPARERGYPTSLLTLQAMNEGAPAAADAAGDRWVSPGWPIDAGFTARAHAAGLQVVPYTLDTAAQLRAAAAAHVDDVITNDPGLAARVLAPERPPIPAPPGAAACEAARADRTLPTIEARGSRRNGLRVFAMQVKQDTRHVVTHEAFRTKIECMIREEVVPRMARDEPNVVAFDEDIGLATIATGSRGREARQRFAGKDSPSCASQGAPCGAVAALGAIGAAYGREQAAYSERFGEVQPLAGGFLAATDTFARGWMQTFSDMARRYGVYILGSNNQAVFRESTDPRDIDLFADPDGPRPRSVFVATQKEVFNEAFLWGPRDVQPFDAAPLRNVVLSNKKVPLTPIELQLGITNGPSRGADGLANLRPYAIPGTGARVGFATSLPAFTYGPPAPDPCADIARNYMRCLDALGTNVVLQDEANPGPWAAYTGASSPDRGAWQALSWMTSTWRAVVDPAVGFAYNVTPHLVGNLADLPFDGQSAITQRGLTGGAGCHYVGNARRVPGRDPEQFEIGGETLAAEPYAGPKSEFVAILPWVRADGPREELMATASALGPDGDGPMENDYAEGVIAADLAFPPDPRRASCVTARSAKAVSRLRATVDRRTLRRDRRTTVRVRVTGDGRPVRRALVRLGHRRARTNAAGVARMRNVRLTGRPGTRALRVTRKGFRRGTATIHLRP